MPALLPYRRFVIHTPLTSAEVTARLRQRVAPRGRSAGREGSFAFAGEVGADRFSLQRIIAYRNSFLPLIEGVVERQPPGSVVTVTMRPHGLVLAFMAFWLSMAVLPGLAPLARWIGGGGPFESQFLVRLGLGTFGIALLFGAFLPEAHKAHALLREAVGADAVERA